MFSLVINSLIVHEHTQMHTIITHNLSVCYRCVIIIYIFKGFTPQTQIATRTENLFAPPYARVLPRNEKRIVDIIARVVTHLRNGKLRKQHA